MNSVSLVEKKKCEKNIVRGKTLYSVFILAAKGLYENAILGRNLISKETDSCRIGAGPVSPPAQPGSPNARKPIGPGRWLCEAGGGQA